MIVERERTRSRDRVLAHRGAVAVGRDIDAASTGATARVRSVSGVGIGQRHLHQVRGTGASPSATRASARVDPAQSTATPSVTPGAIAKSSSERSNTALGRGVLDLEPGVTGEVDRDDRSEVRRCRLRRVRARGR